MPGNLKNSTVPQDWKRLVFIPIPKKGNAPNFSNYCVITPILPVFKVILNILQARLQPYMNLEFPDFQAGFRKGRGTRSQLPTSVGSLKKQESSKKNIYFCLIDYTKAFECVGHNKLENS